MSDEKNIVDIKGLDKAALLNFTWNYAKSFAGSMGSPAGFAEVFGDKQAADRALQMSGGHIDYFNGRPIKIDFSKDQVDPRLYDRDSTMPFAKVVEEFRLVKPNL